MIEGRDLQERSRPRELQEHEDEGHSLPGRWVNSHELRAGDWIITRSGTRALITEIRQHFEPAFPVSNLTILGHHNYSVGDVGVLVHNVSVCDGTIADLRKLRADGMSEGEIKDWLRSKTDDNGNRLYNDDEIDKALGRILAPNNVMRSPKYGNYVRRVDDYKHALDPDHVKAALREKGGAVTGINPKNGLPWDHLSETRNAMAGAKERLIQLKKYSSDPGLSPQLRAAVESELGELSKMLDNAEKILGELAR